MTCWESGTWSGFGVCAGDTLMIVGMLVSFIGTVHWLWAAKWMPALFATRNVVVIVKVAASVIGSFAALWLSVTRLIMNGDRSFFDFSLCVLAVLTFVASFIASLLNKTACSAVPKYVLAAWWATFVLMMPRVTLRAELQGTTEDNTVRTMFVATGVMSFALLVPKTAISHTFAHSLLLTPALSKLCVDGLRITFEALFVTRILGIQSLDWMAVIAPALMLDGTCLLWLFQKAWSRRTPEQKLAWEAAESGVLVWSVFAGFPWGTIAMVMWALASDVGGWQLSADSTYQHTFPSRFIIPYLILPLGATAVACWRIWTACSARSSPCRWTCTILGTVLVLVLSTLPVTTVIGKLEDLSVMSWSGALTPLLLFIFATFLVCLKLWHSKLRFRSLDGSNVFQVLSEQYRLLSSEGIEIPTIHRPVLSVAHWMALGDSITVFSVFVVACFVLHAVANQQTVYLEMFLVLLVGELINVACTLSVVIRTEVIPFLRMVWAIRKAAVAVDEAVFLSHSENPAELFPVTEATPLLTFAAMSNHRGSRDAFDTPGEFPIMATGTGLSSPESKTPSVHYDLEASKCVVCLTHPREVLLRPCRHAVLCKACATGCSHGNAYNISSCPICRSPILNRERIFL